MQLQITFDTAANRNTFAAKTGYAAADQATLTAHAALYNLAKSAAGFASAVHVGDPIQAVVKASSTTGLDVVQDLSNGFYLVNTADFVALSNSGLDSVEPADTPIKLLGELDGAAVADPLTADAQWARIRISNRYRPFGTSFMVADYTALHTPEIIVVDSGINFAHPEFAGLATENLYKLDKFANFGDVSGHGTAVASAATGLNVGLIRTVKLVNVKVFEGDVKPTLIELGATMDAILAHHTASPTVPKVVNMSWVTSKSLYLEGKINALIDAGLIVVAAAGNQGVDVADLTPAGMARAITIGAIDKDDVAAGYNDFAAADATITTNSGKFLDFFAPGVNVTLAKWSGGYVLANGTSASAGYASGCVAGLMCLIPTWPQSFETMIDTLVNDSITGALLLDPAKFSDNQNRMIRLPMGQNSVAVESDLYLGAFSDTVDTLSGDIALAHRIFTFGDDEVAYELVWDDAALQAEFGSSVSLNAETGDFVITKPTVALPASVKIKLVHFKIKMSTSTITKFTNRLSFFHVNPAYDADALTAEVNAELENLNFNNFFNFVPAELFESVAKN